MIVNLKISNHKDQLVIDNDWLTNNASSEKPHNQKFAHKAQAPEFKLDFLDNPYIVKDNNEKVMLQDGQRVVIGDFEIEVQFEAQQIGKISNNDLDIFNPFKIGELPESQQLLPDVISPDDPLFFLYQNPTFPANQPSVASTQNVKSLETWEDLSPISAESNYLPLDATRPGPWLESPEKAELQLATQENPSIKEPGNILRDLGFE